ncbi:unnamed protein product [Ectocarpus sp. CCAP 1310/34]|nr:unnamed protein product [Ectocarpus sp. CCAP 1310/34]
MMASVSGANFKKARAEGSPGGLPEEQTRSHD